MTTKPPAARQRGLAGEITAARKVRVFDVPLEKALAMLDAGKRPPEHLANALHLEWFSPRAGAFTIETADFRLTISEPAWRFTAAEIAARERQIADEATPFMTAFRNDGEGGEWDEFRNEQLLRESDAGSERYRRLLEKYADHSDSERLIAHEMGWALLGQEPDETEAAEIARSPYLDGNGRLGRLLITFLLCAEGMLQEPMLYLSLYFNQNRQAYYKLLQRVRIEGVWEEWLRFFLDGARLRKARSSAPGACWRSSKKTGRRPRGWAARRVRRCGCMSICSGNRSLRSAPLRRTPGSACELTGGKYGRLYAYQQYLDILSEGMEPLR